MTLKLQLTKTTAKIAEQSKVLFVERFTMFDFSITNLLAHYWLLLGSVISYESKK